MARISSYWCAGQELRLQVPAKLNGQLRSYQRVGVQFLFRQYAQSQGGVLGDDMVSSALQQALWVGCRVSGWGGLLHFNLACMCSCQHNPCRLWHSGGIR